MNNEALYNKLWPLDAILFNSDQFNLIIITNDFTLADIPAAVTDFNKGGVGTVFKEFINKNSSTSTGNIFQAYM